MNNFNQIKIDMTSRLTFTRLLTTLFLMLLSFAASAQQWYQVELVVFERFSGANAEAWPVMTDIRQGELEPGMSSNYIQPAAAENLAGVAERLQNSADYRVLYYKAWQQPLLSKGSAEGVSIRSDDEMVEGTLKLYKMTYLHADIDLWLKENSAWQNSWSDLRPEGENLQGPNNPHLQQIRRIRSEDLIYFDHPRIAAILQLTPVATPAAAVSETPESYSLPAAADVTEAQ